MSHEADLSLLELASQWDYRAATDVRVADLLVLLERIREAKRNLADAEDYVSKTLYAELGRGEHDVDGRRIEVFPGTARTEWQHSELTRAAIVELAKSRGGDLTEVEEVVTAWLEVCGTSGWKLRGIRALGLSPDEFSHSRPGKPSVRLP